MSKDMTLVVMAAGMGSRFGGLKQMEPVGEHGEAILDYSVYDAKKAGFNKVVFIIKHEIEEDFKKVVGARIEKKIKVEYVFQETDKLPAGYKAPESRTKPWGTGHAVLMCKGVVNEPFAVINADDYYGAGGFKKLYDFQTKNTDWCMVGFKLQNTITENGTVSRGVCATENGYLTGVVENTKIDGNCVSHFDDGDVKLSPETVVSMNMWGFTPDIFSYIEDDFKKFLDLHIEEPKSEFYLPFVVDNHIKSGEKKVKMLTTDDKWYGVTYREDKETVVEAIRAKTQSGEYENI